MSSRSRSPGSKARRLQQAGPSGNAHRPPGPAARPVENDDDQSSVAGEEDPGAALEFLHAPPDKLTPADASNPTEAG